MTSDQLRCPLCRSPGFEVFLEVPRVPVHVGVVWPTAEAARNSRRGDIRLAHCRQCQFVANVAFDAGLVDYRLRYDNALHFSGVFQRYERSLAASLVERYGLRGKHVVELGCGSGRFLGLLCEEGQNRGTGFDPSHDPEHADPAVGRTVEVIRDYYGERYADRPADLVCCRHVLEHVADPVGFLATVRSAVARNPDAVLYFEVPNAFLALRRRSIWDVIYEHVLYFVPDALEYLFRSCGFEVLAIREDYDEQFIGIEARLAGADPSPAPLPPPSSDLRELTRAYAREFERVRAEWSARLHELAAADQQVAVWGAGAKTVSFVNLIDGTDRSIGSVVDMNPGKQGSFLAGTGHAIDAPSSLAESRPDVVIVMNPIYRSEIEAELHSLGLAPRVVPV